MSASLLLAGSLGVLGVGIAVLCAGFLTTVTRPSGKKGPTGITKALTSIEQRYSQRPARVEGAPQGPSAFSGMMAALALRLYPKRMADSLQRRLDRAGHPENWNPDRVLAVKGLALVGMTLLGLLVQFPHYALMAVWAGVGGVGGFFVPDLLLHSAGVKRQAQIQRLLPDAMDMLTISVEAGLGFEAALTQVAQKSKGPLAAEFSRVLQEQQIGKSRGEALRAMADRSSLPELRSFAHSLVQATEMGIPIAQVLREQAKEMRLKRRQRAEEQAQKLTVKILFPLVICLFPALMIVIIGPGALRIVHALFGHG